MSYLSSGFFLIVLCTACIYYLVPKRMQWVVLLVASVGVYASFGVANMWMLAAVMVSTYGLARRISSVQEKKKRKYIMLVGVVFDFALLALVKLPTGWHLLQPLGISFYTFQSVSYLVDVYHGKVEAEQNFAKLALFLIYFPQMLQGPIGRYERLAGQFTKKVKFDIKNIEYGAQRIAFGLAKKLILADRAYVVCNRIFSWTGYYSGAYILVGMLTFSIYEYCDFSGGIDVIMGVSEMFGIQLDENFRQPYFSKSIGEFWRRWHITLGTWMKDYVFYPFSISKKMHAFGKWTKKHFGKHMGKVLPVCIANLLVFFVVGVWHGLQSKYILYGFYNGIIIAVSNLCKPGYAKMAKICHINTQSRVWHMVQILRTFVLVNIGWLFDGCATAAIAWRTFLATGHGFTLKILTDGSLYTLGIAKRDWQILCVAVAFLFAISLMKERGIDVREWLAKKPLFIRWAVYLMLIFATAPFGYVGSSTEFMYAQF